jgi:6-phosphogluconolactonase (cycloisomerase 2 family)
MRMKFNKSSQLLVVSAVSLLTAGLITACATATTDFVFVTSSKAAGTSSYGEVDVFEINRVSGYMRQIPTSPFPSGGRDPVAEATSPDNTNLYVVNQLDNTIVQFLIGSDGKLYPENTYDTTGNYTSSGIESPVGSVPVAVAANGSNLFVANSYQPLSTCSVNEPCSGSIGVYPILTAAQAEALTPAEIADSLGTPVANPSTGANYWPLNLTGSSDIMVPTAVHVLSSGAYVFVSAYDSTTTTSNASYIFAFAVGSGGALSPVSGSPFTVAGGVKPSGIGSDSTSSYVYVTDSSTGEVYGFSVASATGVLTSLSGSPYTAGNGPSSIAVDSTYAYAYVANATDGNVSAYSIGSNGALTRIGTYAAGIDPLAIGIDPSTSHFVFTANFTPDGVYGTVSDFQMDTTAGTLINTASSPYKGNAQLTAVAAIPHGSSQK